MHAYINSEHFFLVADKEAADKLSKTVDEACLLLAEYNGRLAAELEDRRQLARMLTEYISSQREALSEREKKLEARLHMHTEQTLIASPHVQEMFYGSFHFRKLRSCSLCTTSTFVVQLVFHLAVKFLPVCWNRIRVAQVGKGWIFFF